MRVDSDQFVVEVTAAINAAGTLQTWLFTEQRARGFATGSADTPASTHVDPRLVDAGRFTREIASDSAIGGATRSAWGDLVFDNTDGELDAWRTYSFWGRAVTIRRGPWDGAYPTDFTTIIEALGAGVDVGIRKVSLSLRDRLDLLDTPICSGTFGGTGGLDGPAEYAGRRKPRAYYDTYAIPLILVDSAKFIYMAAQNPCAASITAYDGGVLVGQGANYADTTTLNSTAPAAGQCRVYIGGPTYVRFASAPSYDVSAIGEFYTTSGNPPDISNLLADELGITSTGATGVNVNAYFDDDTTYLAALAAGTLTRPSYFGFDRLGQLVAGVIADPVGGTPLFTFDRSNIDAIERRAPTWCPVPAWKVQIDSSPVYSYGSNLAPTANALFRRRFYKSYTATDSAVLTKHAGSRPRSWAIQGTYANAATDWLGFVGADRDEFEIVTEMTAATIAVELADCVEIVHNRFGLSGGKNFLVVGIEMTLSAPASMRFVLWG